MVRATVGICADAPRSGRGAGAVGKGARPSVRKGGGRAVARSNWLHPKGPSGLLRGLTDFRDTVTDFRDTRRIFAPPCVIVRGHPQPWTGASQPAPTGSANRPPAFGLRRVHDRCGCPRNGIGMWAYCFELNRL